MVVLKCTWYQFWIIFWQIYDLVLYIFHFILCMLLRSFLLWKVKGYDRPNFNMEWRKTYSSYISWISALYLFMSDGLDSSTLIWRLFIISASCWMVSKIEWMIPATMYDFRTCDKTKLIFYGIILYNFCTVLKRSSFFVLFKVSNLLLRPW